MTRATAIYAIGCLLLLLPCTQVLAQCVGPDQSAVQKAVSAAAYGARIDVCGGSATWTAVPQGCRGNSMLCMKKAVVLQGGVGGPTVITLSGAAPYGAICFEPDVTSVASDIPFEFSGFIVDAGGTDYAEGMLDIRNHSTAPISRVKIHHNTFQNGASSGHAILINGPVYGVAYSNTLIDIGTAIKVEGGNENSWNLGHREYGTANSFFFEDNIMSFTSAKVDDFGSTAGQGGSLVFRYNTINAANNTTGNELFDLHGLQSMSSSNSTCNGGCDGAWAACFAATTAGQRCSSEWSQVKSEIYGNSWTNLGNAKGGYSYWLIHRGSWLLMYFNGATGTYSGASAPRPQYRQYACDESQNPAKPAYSQHIQNTYVFNNRYNGTDKPLGPYGPLGRYGADYCASGVGTYTITENVDYFNLAPAFDGSSGVGCGSIAARPSTCSVGVGYWATEQSCSDLTGLVGTAPSAHISGMLYKCTAPNTWTRYYAPYVYPHPLRGPARPEKLSIKK